MANKNIALFWPGDYRDKPNEWALPGVEGATRQLENALKNYKGAVVFVSHDRYFINKVATKTLVIENKEIKEHESNYLKK